MTRPVNAARSRAPRLASLAIVVTLACLPALVFAQASSLPEADKAAQWFRNILSPVLLLSIGTIAIAGAGIFAYFGRLSWEWAYRIMMGSLLTFGCAAIAAKLQALF